MFFITNCTFLRPNVKLMILSGFFDEIKLHYWNDHDGLLGFNVAWIGVFLSIIYSISRHYTTRQPGFEVLNVI